MNNQQFLKERAISLRIAFPAAIIVTSIILAVIAWKDQTMSIQSKITVVPITVLFLTGLTYLTLRVVWSKTVHKLVNGMGKIFGSGKR